MGEKERERERERDTKITAAHWVLATRAQVRETRRNGPSKMACTTHHKQKGKKKSGTKKKQ